MRELPKQKFKEEKNGTEVGSSSSSNQTWADLSGLPSQLIKH